MVNLQEAFSKLNMMESSDYELLKEDEKDAMKDFLDDDEVEAEDVDIIDPQAEDEADLEDTYVGKIIVQCPVCKSLIYKTQEELDEMGDDPQNCPYCFSVENFDLIGKIVPIEDETAPEVIPEEAPEEEPVEEAPVEECVRPKFESVKRNLRSRRALKEAANRKMKEDLENVTIETENEIINVSSEEKAPAIEELPVDHVINDEPAEEEHETAEVIAPLDDEEDSIDIDEIDEESFDEFAESLLKEKYSNIINYRTNRIKDCGSYALAEGVVRLKNGQKKLTEFKIRPSKLSRNKTGACLVENVQLKTRKITRVSVK